MIWYLEIDFSGSSNVNRLWVWWWSSNMKEWVNSRIKRNIVQSCRKNLLVAVSCKKEGGIEGEIDLRFLVIWLSYQMVEIMRW